MGVDAVICYLVRFYSERSAIAGSFFAAILDGINPASILRRMLIANIKRHCHQEIYISPLILKIVFRIALMAKEKPTEMMTPMSPEYPPSIADSARKTRDMSFFLAPIERSTPISFLRSRTDVYMMIAIIIVDTMSEIAANATRTPVMVLTIVLTKLIIVDKLSP